MQSNEQNNPVSGAPPAGHGRYVVIVAVLLLFYAAAHESLRYFAPVTIEAGGKPGVHRLPDSTQVALNAGGKLRLGADWNKEKREVWLEGEAYFTVPVPADTSVLTIHTPWFDLEASGAKLYVQNRHDSIRAWVQQGHVLLVAHGDKINRKALLPGDLVEYTGRRIISKSNQSVQLPARINGR